MRIKIVPKINPAKPVIPADNSEPRVQVPKPFIEEKLPIKFTCEQCGLGFSRFLPYKTHKRHCHEKIPCQQCSKKFKSKCGLMYHMNKHKGLKPYQCRRKPVCKKTFYHPAIRNKHEDRCIRKGRKRAKSAKWKKEIPAENYVEAPDRDPENPDIFQCKLCPAFFKLRSLLQHHLNEHTGVNPYKCPRKGCKESFPNPRLRSYHVASCGKDNAEFVCKICQTTLKGARVFRSHMWNQHEVAKYNCEECGKKYQLKQSYEAHMDMCHSKSTESGKPGEAKSVGAKENKPERPRITCAQCGKSYATTAVLKRHLLHCNAPTSCAKCNRTFRTPTELQYHMNRHNGLKPFECRQTAGCPRRFPHPGRRNKHELTCGKRKKQKTADPGPGRRVLPCEECNKKFATAGHLESHKRRCKGKPEPVVPKPRRKRVLKPFDPARSVNCDRCGKSRPTPGLLRKHLLYCSIWFPCPQCPAKFRIKSELGYHLNGHTGATPFGCRKDKKCTEKFATPGQRGRHEAECGKTKVRKPVEMVPCDRCGRKMRGGGHLEKHKLICKTAEITEPEADGSKKDEEKTFKCRVTSTCLETFPDQRQRVPHEMRCVAKGQSLCETCFSVFKTRAALKKHQKSCAGKEFPCRLCDVVLSTRDSLRVHLLGHDSRKNISYDCSVCPKRFTKKSNFLEHIKEHDLDPKEVRFKCTICSTSLKNQKTLRLHMNIHNGVNPYKCRNENCTQAFYAPQPRAFHEEQCIKVSLSCDICDVKVNCSRDFRLHMKTHQTSGFECRVCEQKFDRKSKLEHHLKVHTNAAVEDVKSENSNSNSKSALSNS